jgi:predicted permease
MTADSLRGLSMTREHWLQVSAILAPIFISILIGTWFLSSQISGVAARLDKDEASIAALQAQQAELARLPVAEERITNLGKVESDHYAEETAFRAEMRGALSNVATLLNDLRVLVGKPQERERR